MRVLIAEDDPISRRVLETMMLRWGYDALVACDGLEAWNVLKCDGSPRLAILDWMMPRMSGVDVCRRVRESQQKDYLYLVLLTARNRKEDIIEGMNAGADDYITKPFDSGELKVRLRAAQRILDLQNELVEAREALRDQATHDFLTGLWNRSAILDMFYSDIDKATREDKSVGVMMVDLDRFKKVNDTHGHKVGDSVLCEVVKRMRRTVRPCDRIGRYGGEEFLIIVPGCDLTFSGYAAERVRADVEEEPIVLPEGLSIPVTVSIGVAAKLGGTKADAETIIYLADEALYRAKRAGRNRVELANPGLVTRPR